MQHGPPPAVWCRALALASTLVLLWRGSAATGQLVAAGHVGPPFLGPLPGRDGSWAALSAGPSSVNALAVLNGTLVAATTATTAAMPFAVGYDGTTWASVGATDPPTPGPGCAGTASALAVVGGVGTLLVGGLFACDESTANATSLMQWDGVAWSAAETAGLNASEAVLALAVYAGEVVVGGAAGTVARWNGTAFESLNGGADLAVYALMTAPGGAAGLLAGGAFLNVGGTAANRIARWNGVAWDALGTGVDGPVYAVAALSDGDGDAGIVVVGGDFTHAGGLAASAVALWDGAEWSSVAGSSLITGGGGTVYALLVYGTTVVAGGDFEGGVAAWTLGSNWTTVPANVSTVLALAVYCEPGSGAFGSACAACPPCGLGSCDDGVEGNGTCACPVGVVGPSCTECSPGYFGPGCAPCTLCAAPGVCHAGRAGNCSCPAGWSVPPPGGACTDCASGYFGPECTPCEACTVLGGACTGGVAGNCSCPAGWQVPPPGQVCSECASGYFGPSCATSCAQCDPPGVCYDGVSGNCSCPDGWTQPPPGGGVCSECAPAYFGTACTSCARCAAPTGTCYEGFNGSCACAANWAGETCSECATGYYGPACAQCPACVPGQGHCSDGTSGTGQCDCVNGFSGLVCDSKSIALQDPSFTHTYGTAVDISVDGIIAVGCRLCASGNGSVTLYNLANCTASLSNGLSGCAGALILTAPDIQTSPEMFGLGVALGPGGFVAVASNHSVGASVANQGAVYLFACPPTPEPWDACTFAGVVYADDASANDFFGISVAQFSSATLIGKAIAVSLPLLAVGAYGKDLNAGAVYVYYCTSAYSCVAAAGRLALPTVLPPGSMLGQAVAVSGALVAATAPGHNAGYLWVCFKPTNCTFASALVVTDMPFTVAISGTLVAVGVYKVAVVLFDCTVPTACVQASRLTAASAPGFGWGVLLSGATLAVVSPDPYQNTRAALYVYDCTNATGCVAAGASTLPVVDASISLSQVGSATVAGIANYYDAGAYLTSQCPPGLFGPLCTYNCSVDCPTWSAAATACTGGVCVCAGGWTGALCNACPLGAYANATAGTCEPCACNPYRVTALGCAAETGQCPCTAAAAGVRCEECATPHLAGVACTLCAGGYYGPDCIQCPECANNGTCYDGVSGNGTCSCPPGFEGALCAHANCIAVGCANGGACQIDGNCTCTANYTGARCETFVPSCLNVPLGCQNNGTCQSQVTEGTPTYVCECDAGYAGDYCGIATSCLLPAESCLNGGSCVRPLTSVNNSVECACVGNFTGSRCQYAPSASDSFQLAVPESTTYWILAGLGAALVAVDAVLLIYFRAQLADASTRGRVLSLATTRLPLFFFGIFDTATDVLFVLVVNGLWLADPDAWAVLYYCAIAFTALPYTINLVGACVVGVRQAVRESDHRASLKWFAVAVAVLLTGDLLDAVRLVVSFDELYRIHRGESLDKVLTKNIGLLVEAAFGGASLRILVLIWLVQVLCKDVPHLVIQALVEVQLPTFNAIVVLSLAATAASALFSMVSFLFLTLVPVMRHRAGKALSADDLIRSMSLSAGGSTEMVPVSYY